MSTKKLHADYDRARLKNILIDVRRHKATINVHEAWIRKHKSGIYEFTYRDFFWCGLAESAAEARAAGWSAWLTKEGVEGYAQN